MKNSALKALTFLVVVLLVGACASQGGAGTSQSAAAVFTAQASELYPAAYTPIEDLSLADTQFGDILQAARGETSGGKTVMAVLARSVVKLDPEGAQQRYDSQKPVPYRILIIIDEETNSVAASKVIRDGTTAEIFAVPQEKLDAYKEVIITSETAFDGFMGGLMTGKQYEIAENEAEETTVIAGTSLYYTGATVQGTYSSQLVRNCFAAAARFYVKNK